MSQGWEGLKPAPIEEFHAEIQEKFHTVATMDHPLFLGNKLKTIDGSMFGQLIAEFKMKIVKEYGISMDAVPKITNKSEAEPDGKGSTG